MSPSFKTQESKLKAYRHPACNKWDFKYWFKRIFFALREHEKNKTCTHPHLYKLLLTFSDSQCCYIRTTQVFYTNTTYLKLLNHILVRQIFWFLLNSSNKCVAYEESLTWNFSDFSYCKWFNILIFHDRVYHRVKYNTYIFLWKTLTACKYLNSSFLKPAGDIQKER